MAVVLADEESEHLGADLAVALGVNIDRSGLLDRNDGAFLAQQCFTV